MSFFQKNKTYNTSRIKCIVYKRFIFKRNKQVVCFKLGFEHFEFWTTSTRIYRRGNKKQHTTWRDVTRCEESKRDVKDVTRGEERREEEKRREEKRSGEKRREAERSEEMWREAKRREEKRREGRRRGGDYRIGGSSIQGEREGLMAQAGHTAAINRRTARNYRLATCEIWRSHKSESTSPRASIDYVD